MKILHWDRGGLVLYYKRLEKGRFVQPKLASNGQMIELDAVELTMLLDGIHITQVKRPRLWKPARTGDRQKN